MNHCACHHAWMSTETYERPLSTAICLCVHGLSFNGRDVELMNEK